MSQIGLFMFGGAISLVVFIGAFLYAMYVFKEWSDRDSELGRQDRVAKAQQP